MLKQDRLKRKRRIKGRIVASVERPRVSIFKSNQHIYAQIIDDVNGVTLASFSDKQLKKVKANKTEISAMVGSELGKLAVAKKVKKLVFDRSGYRYHGRVKALAEALRKEGLEL